MSLLNECPYLETLRSMRSSGTKIYLVGGFLRNYLLGITGTDFDFAVSGNAIKTARRFARKVKGAFVLLDQDRGCARVAKKQNGQLLTFDFANFRARTLSGDLAHRDFTVNAFCLELGSFDPEKPLLKQLIDPRKGLRDLKACRIQMTSAGCFKEDPLRLVRAFSLRSLLGFRIEKKTASRIKKDRVLLRNVSAERVRDELFKVLSSRRAAATLKEMDKIGLLEEIMPQIHVMYNVKQGGYHHLDVWSHSLETVRQIENVLEESENDPDIFYYLNESLAGERKRFALMKLAALLHDIGKPQTKKKEKGRMSFHGHEHVGKNIVRSVSRMLKLSTRERHSLEDMVRWHLRPGYLSNFKNPSEKSIFRYLRDTRDEAISVLLLSLADQRSTRGPLTTERDQQHHERIVRSVMQKYFEKQKEEPFVRFISGRDLIKKLKLKPSPLFAKILSAVEEKQELGEIKTKKDALKFARIIAEGINK